MKNVTVKENHLTFGGVAYFRAHAEEVEIGSIGETRRPLFRQNYLEVKDRIKVPDEDIIQATVTEIDFDNTLEVDLNMGATALVEGVPVKLDGDTTFKKFRSGELKLVKFSILNNDIKRIANDLKEELNDLKRWGKKARIVHQVFVVMEASLANKFNKNINVKISAGNKGLEADLGAEISSESNTKVKISKDTCFAYLMLKIEWNKNGNEIKILDLNDDQWGVS